MAEGFRGCRVVQPAGHTALYYKRGKEQKRQKNAGRHHAASTFPISCLYQPDQKRQRPRRHRTNAAHMYGIQINERSRQKAGGKRSRFFKKSYEQYADQKIHKKKHRLGHRALHIKNP